jgi:uncharacterized membrane protein YhdT
MSADQIFSLANSAAVLCWILLAIFPGRPAVTNGIAGTVLPALFAVAYVAIVIAVFPNANGSFSTLAGVIKLFANPWLVLAGWLHYLAFDLLIGAWEARDSVEHGVPRWALIPCLFLTLMFGPAGWLAYKIIKSPIANRQSRVRRPES